MKQAGVPVVTDKDAGPDARIDKARACIARDQHAQALATLASLPDKLEKRPVVHITRARALHGLGRYAEAEKTARAVLGQNPASQAAHRVICRAVIASDTPDRIVEVLQEALDADTDLTGFDFAFQMLHQLPDASTKPLREALAARFPENAKTWLARFDRLQSRMRGGSSALDHALLGDRDSALAALTEDCPEVRDIGSLDEAIRLVTAIPGPDRRERDLVQDTGEDILISARGQSGTTVVVFAGLQRRAMVDIDVLDAFFAAAGFSAIYLRDPARNLHLNGVSSIAPDRPATIAALRGHLAALGTRRIVTLGSSAGGYPAILYGLELGAERIVSLGGPTGCSRDILDAAGDRRGQIILRRLHSLIAPGDLDLRPRLLAASPAPRITIAFGADVPIDAAHARRLADIDGVSLLPLKDHARHKIITPMLISGQLMELLSP